MTAQRWTIERRPSRRTQHGTCDGCGAFDCEQPIVYAAGRTIGLDLFLIVYGRGHTKAKAIALAEAAAAAERRDAAELAKEAKP